MSLAAASKVLPLLGAVCLLSVAAFFLHSSTSQPTAPGLQILTNPPFAPWYEQNILDGCHHVYLDMGTNMWGLVRSNNILIQWCPDKEVV